MLKTTAASRGKTLIGLAAAFVLLMVRPCAAAQDGSTIRVRMGIHFVSSMGQSSAQVFDMAKGITNAIKDNYGLDLQLKTYSSGPEIKEAFLRNEIDAAAFWPGEAVEIMERGGSVHPWSTFHVKKSKKSPFCLWQRKNENPQGISAVAGKRLINTEYSVDWLLFLREFLYRNGIDKPLWRVFSSFTSVSGSNSAFMAVAAGDADFFWTYKDNEVILKLVSSNMANQVSHDFCSDSVYARATIVFNGKTLSKDDLIKSDKALVNFIRDINELAKTNMGIKTLKQYMGLVQSRIVPARPDEFDYEVKLFKESRKRGWMAEAEFIVEQMDKAPKGKPVEIKTDYKTCRALCAGDKDEVKCVSDCMK